MVFSGSELLASVAFYARRVPRQPKRPRPVTGAGRPNRRQPDECAGEDWLAEPFDDQIEETARLFAINLRTAIDETLRAIRGRSAAEVLGIDHQPLRKVMLGNSYPNLPFIENAESKLKSKAVASTHA